MVDPTPPLPGLSPVAGEAVVARFDGGRLSSDGGLPVLREIERRLRVAERLAACLDDPRDPDRSVHSLADVIRFRLLMVAAGYEDGNDATRLRADPLFKLALERLPAARDLCSRSTISRLENLPNRRALLRMGRAMVDLYRASFRHVPGRIVLDIDDTLDAVHGGQQLRLFNAHYDGYGFQPIVVFDDQGRFVTALLRPAKRPNGREIRAVLRRLIRAIRGHWPRTAILVRADGHYACPEVLDWCEAHGIDYVVGLGSTTTPRRHVTRLEASTAARFEAAPHRGKVRRFKEFYDGAGSWSRVRRIVARVEAGPQGGDTRFIVTNLWPGHGAAPLRGPVLPAWPGRAPRESLEEAHLAADRTSCPAATANQFRLFLHAGAYWLLWRLRALMPRRSSWRVAQFDSLRLGLIKLAARVVELKTRVAVHLPTSAPAQAIIHLVLGRRPRLVT